MIKSNKVIIVTNHNSVSSKTVCNNYTKRTHRLVLVLFLVGLRSTLLLPELMVLLRPLLAGLGEDWVMVPFPAVPFFTGVPPSLPLAIPPRLLLLLSVVSLSADLDLCEMETKSVIFAWAGMPLVERLLGGRVAGGGEIRRRGLDAGLLMERSEK